MGQILPSITGNAQADTNIRYATAVIGASVVGIGIGWAKAHGFSIPDADTLKLYSQLIGGVVMFVGAWIWGTRATARSEATVVANTVQAAATRVVPEIIASRATQAQATLIQQSPAEVRAVPSVKG